VSRSQLADASRCEHTRTPPSYFSSFTSSSSSSPPLSPTCKQSEKSSVKVLVRAAMSKGWANEWQGAKQGGLTRTFFPRPECMGRVGTRQLDYRVVQILTGHSFLNGHLYRVGYSASPSCRCGESVESVEHFLFHCDQFRGHRERFSSVCLREMGSWPPALSSVHRFDTVFREMVRYIRATGRLGYPSGVEGAFLAR